MAETNESGVARRAFLGRGIAITATGAAAGVLANIEQLMASEGSQSGAGFVAYMAHDQKRAQNLVNFMSARGFKEQVEFSVTGRGEHRDIWGRGTLPFDTVQTIMVGGSGFAVLVGDGATSTSRSAPHAQVWMASAGVASTKAGTGFAPSSVVVATEDGAQEDVQ
jgi:hypothetical protein